MVGWTRAQPVDLVNEPIGAVDIGATKVEVALADRNGHLQPGTIQTFETPETPEDLAKAIIEAVRQLDPGRTMRWLGCGAPGPIDAASGTILRLHNRGWPPFPLGPWLTEALGVSVVLDDDASAASLAEAITGAGAGLDPVAYLTVGSGVGAGVVSGGRLLRGAHGNAGEIGHLVIDPDGPPCGCGRRGDIESLTGGRSLAMQAATLWPTERLPGGGPSPRSAADIFVAAQLGEPVAQGIVNSATDALAFAMAVLMSTVDPERIVVGGSVALAHPQWVEDATSRARVLCLAEAGADLDVAMAALGHHSVLAGAALLAARAVDAPPVQPLNPDAEQ
jgi:glucokinase